MSWAASARLQSYPMMGWFLSAMLRWSMVKVRWEKEYRIPSASEVRSSSRKIAVLGSPAAMMLSRSMRPSARIAVVGEAYPSR